MASVISIIVPIYKVEKYLNRCVQSIVDQTYSNLDIILVDDGSPDCCPQICDEWSKKDSRIRVIHQENKGVSAARNMGLSIAQGDYLYFVDGDDWIDRTLCEKVMAIFHKNDVDIVAFNCDKVDESGDSLGSTEKMKEGVISIENSLMDLLQGNMNSYMWNKVFKRRVFQNIWFPDRSAFEDMAIAYKLFVNASKIYCLNEQLYFYFQRSDSATAVISAKKLGELFLSRWESYEYLKPLYPEVAQIAFHRTAYSALLLHDRSLIEPVNEEVYATAMNFMKENREQVLKSECSLIYWLFYTFPKVYKIFRCGRRMVGNIVRAIRKK